MATGRSYGEIRHEAFDQMIRRLDDNIIQINAMLAIDGEHRVKGKERSAMERAKVGFEKAWELTEKAARAGDPMMWRVYAEA